jgi:hypothetical protein
MPLQSGWKKLALVCAVCGVHLALLTGFNLNLVLGKPSYSANINSEKLSITLRLSTIQPLSEGLVKPQTQASAIRSQAADAKAEAPENKPFVSEASYWTGWLNSVYFLDAEAVDTTAEPDDIFASLLANILPLDTPSLVLEFWIGKDGRTVEVRCIEGACTDEVVAALSKMAGLTFKPATKNGEAVANRKVIQIEPKTSFDL